MKKKIGKIITGFMILFLSLGIFLYFTAQLNAKDDKKEKKILYYRNPMDPTITSPTFMKDSMGMDNIPVYEDTEEEPTQEAVVKISGIQQELIGVKTETIIPRPLMRMIRTVAKIAYDPELYKTEQEFIQAVKTKEELKSNQSPEITKRLDALVGAANLKLRLQGLSDQQIEALKTETESDRALLISDALNPYVWAYLTIYEYDLGSVKTGDHVVLKAIAYTQDEFSGKIIEI